MRAFAAILAVLCLLGPTVTRAASRGESERPTRSVAIAINGEPLATDVPPITVAGRLLVPLRDVFAALGITITRAGSTITARLPTGNVRMHVGSRDVEVDGKSVVLDAPVIDTNGTTYAPLRLLVAAFGAQATYDQRGAKVEIVSAFVGRNIEAEQQRAGGGTDVQGVVAAVDLNSAIPTFTVVRGGTSRTISVTSDAKIWTEDVTIHSQVRATLADVRVGDAIHAILTREGRVVSVFDFYKSTSGTVSAATAAVLVLASGRVVTPTKTTQISINSAPAKIDDVKVGDYVTVRSNPESGELRQIVVSRTLAAVVQNATPAAGTPGATQISSVALSVAHPIRVGESFDVTMRGTPGGRGSFDIGDLLTGLSMREAQPGTYVGHFTVPPRFNVTQSPVYGRLSVGSNEAPRTQAAQTLSATSTPPVVGEVAPPPGQTVNNRRPSIFATFSAPTEIAINTSSIALEVNGHDVTSAATRTNGFITYSPGVDLPPGPIAVTVRVADAAGNAATKSWSFSIAR
ncbi:MAG: hypothetical protein NVS2B8_16940 [Vulcanimicrobiaceae bacterium]